MGIQLAHHTENRVPWTINGGIGAAVVGGAVGGGALFGASKLPFLANRAAGLRTFAAMGAGAGVVSALVTTGTKNVVGDVPAQLLGTVAGTAAGVGLLKLMTRGNPTAFKLPVAIAAAAATAILPAIVSRITSEPLFQQPYHAAAHGNVA